MPDFEIALLGPWQLRLAGQIIPRLPTAKALALLAYLAVEAEHAHARHTLTGLLWADYREDSARQNLRKAIQHLRHAVPAAYWLVTNQAIQFHPSGGASVDVTTFTTLLAACRRHDHSDLLACPQCSERLQAAVALYRGDFLTGFIVADSPAFEEWALLKREWLRREVLQALFHLAAYHERHGDYDAACSHAWRQIELEPSREAAYQQIMRSLARSGRRSEALAHYETCRKLLAADLGVLPSAETMLLFEQIRSGAFASPPQPGAAPEIRPAPHNLPAQLTPLIGRTAELAELAGLLANPDVRLVTLLGPGGIGKTRLALHVASNVHAHFADGVYFVSLAPIRDPELVSGAIAQALGVRGAPGRPLQESLQECLREKQLLLVLDNFEQVVTAAVLVGALLSDCRRLKVLATSRTTLHLYGEHEFPISPLALPDSKQLAVLEQDPISSTTEFASIELFFQRAKAVKPDFALTAANAADVAKICLVLDGLPLAIELAAARIKIFSPSALLQRLNQRLALLTGGPHDLPARQRTLRDEIAWSYDLLTAKEQTLFQRLAVFVGGFTLEAAQAVGSTLGDPTLCSGHPQAVEVLAGAASLVDQNLLRQEQGTDSEPRFAMLETIREYGLEMLAASGELEVVQRCYAQYYLTLAEEGNRKRKQGEQAIWLPRMEREHSNWRTALAWHRAAGDVEQEMRLAGEVWYFWVYYGYVNEGRNYLENLLARTGGMGSQQARANVIEGAGSFAFLQGDNQTARLRLEECLALATVLGDKWLIANVHLNLGWVALHQGDHALAAVQVGKSLVIAREVEDKFSIAIALYAMGDLATGRGEYERSCSFYEESRAIWQPLGAKWDIAMSLHAQAKTVRLQGDRRRARALNKASLALWRELGSSRAFAVSDCLEELARLYAMDQELVYAARLFGAAEALHELLGTPLLVDERAAMRIQMGAEAFLQAWKDGREMPTEQAVDYALALPDVPASTPSSVEPSPVLPPPATYPAGLTPREVEVLRLLVQGLTYAQIAEKLVVSRRTVNAHATTIYSKLGVTSRAIATRLAIDHHLI